MDVETGTHRRTRRPWRLLTPLAFVAAGTLMVTSAISSGGTDLRPERFESLAGLARSETQRVQALHERAAELNREITTLGKEVKGPALRRAQDRGTVLKPVSGLTAVEGPGLTVTLDDAPRRIRETAGANVRDAFVHQQDIQAVANAMWVGGAEAMTIQGQRVVSTTGIKCVGNTVLLQGVTYSPPYVISAIGDVAAMRASIDSNPYILGYLRDAAVWQLGWDVQEESRLQAPAYDGPVDLSYAQPVRGS